MDIDSGKYGHITRRQGDIQHKLMHATVAQANEEGERNKLLRIQVAMDLIKLSDADKAKIEDMIGEELDLEDSAIE